MEIQDYQNDSQRTMAALGLTDADVPHMLYGMFSELVELDAALKSGDNINIGEEVSDVMWYHSNYCRIKGITYNDLLDSNFELNVEDADLFVELTNNISRLANLEKRELAYGKIPDEVDRMAICYNIFAVCDEIYYENNLVAKQCLKNNIDKLKVRFTEKFNTQDALTRDLEKERTELEK